MVKDSIAFEYAAWCAADKTGKVPKYVKKQAASWIDIVLGNNPGAVVDEKGYDRICRLLKIIIHPDLHCSIYDGLEDYAWLFIVATLCTKDASTGYRYYSTAVLEIARKNFKTFNSAIIFILLMLTEPDFSRFFSVAPDLRLSSELKVAIRKIIRSSPALVDELEPAFKVMRSVIRCLINDNEYTPLAYSNDRMDASTASVFLADEAGAMDDYPIEAMRSSQIHMPEGLGIVISTQYPNDNNSMLTEIDISKKVLDGLIENERRFSLLYEPDDEYKVGDLWQQEDNVLYQSNPVAVKNEKIMTALKAKRSMAILYENKRENFLCKHCNILYKGLGVEGYIDVQRVKLCSIPDDREWWKGRRVWIGLDLSQSDDNTAFSMVTEDQGIVYSKTFGFIPEDKKDFKSKKEHVDYDRLIKQGICYSCGADVIDYLFVKERIEALPEEYGVEIQQIGYDRWNALATVQALEADGFECVEIKQHSSVLHMPTKWLRELILEKSFRYSENRMLEINFQNARCTEDTNLNKYVNKKRSSGKVDMVVSLINAMYLLQQDLLYGDNGFVVQVI